MYPGDWQWLDIYANPDSLVRLLIATYNGYVRGWVTINGTTYGPYQFNLSFNETGESQKVRRVSSVLTRNDYLPAKALNNKWRNVYVATPTDMHYFQGADLDPSDSPGNAPHNETKPPGYEGSWISYTTYNQWYNEDVHLNISSF